MSLCYTLKIKILNHLQFTLLKILQVVYIRELFHTNKWLGLRNVKNEL